MYILLSLLVAMQTEKCKKCRFSVYNRLARQEEKGLIICFFRVLKCILPYY
jgi:hypothetical protein